MNEHRNFVVLPQKHLDAVKRLIRRYRSLALKKISDALRHDFAAGALNTLTGFGNKDTCMLCQTARQPYKKCVGNCIYCIHGHGVPINTIKESRKNEFAIYVCMIDDTYADMDLAWIPEDLMAACRARADYLEKLLDIYNNWLSLKTAKEKRGNK